MQQAAAVLHDDRDLKVDWFRIIVDLERAGYHHAAIGIAIDCPRTTVIGWKQGATPKYDDGDLLIVLWCAVTKNSRDSVPRVPRYSHLA